MWGRTIWLLAAAASAAPVAAQITDPTARARVEQQLGAAVAEQDAAYRAADKARAYAIGSRVVALFCQRDGPASPGCATANHNWGASLLWQERYGEAVDAFRRALAIADANGTDAAATVDMLLQATEKAGDFAALIPLRERQLRKAEAAGGASSDAAILTRRLLTSDLMRLQRHADAEVQARRTWTLLGARFGPNHPETVQSAGAMVTLLFLLGRIDEAGDFADRALNGALVAFGPAASETGRAWQTVGGMRRHRGEYDAAIDAYRSALVAFDANGERFPDDRILTLVNMAECLEAMGRYAEAEPFRSRAVVEPKAHANNIPAYRIDLGRNLIAQGKVPEGRAMIAEETARQVAIAPSAGARLASMRFALAQADLAAGDAAAARRAIENALAAPAAANWPEGQKRRARALLAEAKARTGDTVGAEADYRALAAQMPGDPAVAAALGTLLMRQSGRAEQAAPFLAAAAATLAARSPPAIVGDGAQKRLDALASSDAAVLRLYADAAWASPAVRGASRPRVFEALQNSMRGSATRAVALQAARDQAATAGLGALAREYQALDDRLAATEALVLASLADPAPDAIAGRAQAEALAEQLRARKAELRTQIERGFPAYFAYLNPSAVELPAFQKLLAPDEAALMLVPSEFGTHIMAVTRDDISWARSDWATPQIETVTRRLLWFAGANVAVSDSELADWQLEVPGRHTFDRKTAYALYQQLIAPIAPVLAGKRHLFVAGAGPLAKLPLSILVSAPPTGSDRDPAAMRATRWFADDIALIHLPSLQALALLRQAPRRAAAPENFLGIGDPLLEGKPVMRDSRGAPGEAAPDMLAAMRAPTLDVGALRKMPRLPGTAIELEALAKAIGNGPASLRLAERARETWVRSAPLDRYRILSFATHGIMAGEVSGAREAGLVLTPPPAPGAGDDGYLATSEVAGLTLNADWVILSACNTASDDGTAGATGMSGLTRAFFYAGARAILASHWPVLDAVAPELTIATLAHPATASRAEALQAAMKTVRDDTSRDRNGDSNAFPVAWAPFVLIGDWR